MNRHQPSHASARTRPLVLSALCFVAGILAGIFLVGLCLGWLDGQGADPRAATYHPTQSGEKE